MVKIESAVEDSLPVLSLRIVSCVRSTGTFSFYFVIEIGVRFAAHFACGAAGELRAKPLRGAAGRSMLAGVRREGRCEGRCAVRSAVREMSARPAKLIISNLAQYRYCK